MAQEQKQKQNQSGNDLSGQDETLEMVDAALLQKKLEEAEKRAEEYLNNWKRERADFLNYKKDEAKIMEEFAKFANEALVLEVIEAMDDLEISVRNSKENTDGFSQVLKKFQDLLKKHGVEQVKTDGAFDPSLHEAVEGSETEGQKLEEIRAGYTMYGKVIRPARVRIIK